MCQDKHKSDSTRTNGVRRSEKILHPEVPQALRLQGILMGGVVIIYSRQTHFLLEDCKDIMVRIQPAVLLPVAAHTALGPSYP